MQNVVQLTEGEAKAGLVGALSWEYNSPINVPQHFSAVCEKTTQNESIVRVQNLSATFDLTFYIIGGGVTETVTISANDRKPWQKVHNFEGSKLRIANISQESASLQATLVDLS